MKLEQALIALLGSALLVPEARSEIISSSETHFVLRHEATSLLPPSTIWERLVQPADWWHPEHTYSGDAKNLSLDLQAGGLWREDWKGHSVQHGRVLYVIPKRCFVLRHRSAHCKAPAPTRFGRSGFQPPNQARRSSSMK